MASNGTGVAGAAGGAAGDDGGGGGTARGTTLLVSAAERDFVTQGIEQGVRPDGRERLASRAIHLDVGVIPGAFGSAQAQCGGTKVVAAVKAELVSPDSAAGGGAGRIEVSVSCTLTASPLFEGQRGEEVAAELTFAMNRMLEGGLSAETRKALSISPQHCWLLLVDAVVLDYDGAMLDVVSSAIYAALVDTRLPKVFVQTGKDGKGVIEMVDNSGEEFGLGLGVVPIFVTLVQVCVSVHAHTRMRLCVFLFLSAFNMRQVNKVVCVRAGGRACGRAVCVCVYVCVSDAGGAAICS